MAGGASSSTRAISSRAERSSLIRRSRSISLTRAADRLVASSASARGRASSMSSRSMRATSSARTSRLAARRGSAGSPSFAATAKSVSATSRSRSNRSRRERSFPTFSPVSATVRVISEARAIALASSRCASPYSASSASWRAWASSLAPSPARAMHASTTALTTFAASTPPSPGMLTVATSDCSPTLAAIERASQPAGSARPARSGPLPTPGLARASARTSGFLTRSPSFARTSGSRTRIHAIASGLGASRSQPASIAARSRVTRHPADRVRIMPVSRWGGSAPSPEDSGGRQKTPAAASLSSPPPTAGSQYRTRSGFADHAASTARASCCIAWSAGMRRSLPGLASSA